MKKNKNSKINKKNASSRKKPLKLKKGLRNKKETNVKTRKIIKKEKNKKLEEKKILIIKPKKNLIISPIREHNWEAWQTFNPGVILLNNRVHFLYRAIGFDGISRFGYASSPDGFFIDERLNYPVYEHPLISKKLNYYSFASGGSFSGAEDPRLTRVMDEDTIYMTYTACDNGLGVGLTSIKVGDFLEKKWNWEKPVLISPPNEVHKNWVIFPEKINNKYAILHSLSPKILINYRDSLKFNENEYISSYYNGEIKEDNSWESRIRGIGAPPLKTKYGWLVFYHGIDKFDFSKYKVGAMLLDLNNPEKILTKLKEPILEPDEYFQETGFKPGIVYASGAVVKDEKILIYYGAADSYVCVAYANFEEFLENLIKNIKPKLKQKKLKKIINKN